MTQMNLDYDELFDLPPYGLAFSEKQELFSRYLEALGEHHKANCAPYRRLCGVLGDSPALPVRLFKEYDLRSSAEEDTVKTMTSSGTTSQVRSRIHLDRDTSMRQAKALMRIVSAFIKEKKRLPMLVVDAPGTVKDRNMFSARTAGIRGFSMMGRDVVYALNDDMTLNDDAIKAFSDAHRDGRVLIFGFTFMIWEYFVKPMLAQQEALDLEGTLVHGGGWKKLVDKAVSPREFKEGCKTVFGDISVHDYYGMVEQTGSIAMECECGHLHASIFSNVEILDPVTMQRVPFGERGLIESISLLPTSYPGNILLTEDEGTILGEDDCPCGRLGRYFVVHGRQKGAEIRGCSDTYES